LTETRPRTWACVICYRATRSDIEALVSVVAAETEAVLVVDNSPDTNGDLASLAERNVTYVAMPANHGTAGAMNEAWRRVIAAGADHLVTFDQDSRPPAGMVTALVRSLVRLQRAGRRVAAIGPVKVDPRTGRPLRLLRPVRWRKRYAAAESGDVLVDHLITSGCLVPRTAFEAVGRANEDLFLDYVDIEWCLRARRHGYELICDGRATMPHVIGDRVVNLGRWSIPLHDPRRNGLLVRNHLLLWRSPAMPVPWLLGDLRQVILKLAVHLVVAPRRGDRLMCIGRGILAGLNRRGGPI
jgi:rhamnosyltransferase